MKARHRFPNNKESIEGNKPRCESGEFDTEAPGSRTSAAAKPTRLPGWERLEAERDLRSVSGNIQIDAAFAVGGNRCVNVHGAQRDGALRLPLLHAQ